MIQPEDLKKLKGIFSGEPVFILGNSPRLPVDDLPLLDGFFSVGVNRIGQVYDPTILLIVDKTAYDEATFGQAQKLLSPLLNMPRRGGAWYPSLFIASEEWSDHPGELHADGNSGVTAAGWANSLGCEPIYLLGMEAKYKGDKSDFYGTNKYHRDGTIQAIAKAKDNLLNTFPHCIPIDSDGLKEAVKNHKPHDRAYFMDKLNGNLPI